MDARPDGLEQPVIRMKANPLFLAEPMAQVDACNGRVAATSMKMTAAASGRMSANPSP